MFLKAPSCRRIKPDERTEKAFFGLDCVSSFFDVDPWYCEKLQIQEWSHKIGKQRCGRGAYRVGVKQNPEAIGAFYAHCLERIEHSDHNVMVQASMMWFLFQQVSSV
jgi:hypothetical protein